MIEARINRKMASDEGAKIMYETLVDPANVESIHTLAVQDSRFRINLLLSCEDIAAMSNSYADPQQASALQTLNVLMTAQEPLMDNMGRSTDTDSQQATALPILNALVAAQVPFTDIAGDSSIRQGLWFLGFYNFFKQPVLDGLDLHSLSNKLSTSIVDGAKS